MIIENSFSVLNNKDTQGFWDRMLDAERRDASLNLFNQVTFINETKEQYVNPSPPGKRKSRKPITSPATTVEINSFDESDSLRVEGLEESVATWVGREGRATCCG
ncbi:hypothetical protein INT45_004720 [Circinella minor]|uniref:Uncharacterized protein n=1 Tax=Circinella minor TaxID=1195481 RepID=A0A8H7VT02_9FUNG|nr:hypothetical protein INT45_004720 [Circinella minor]